MTMNNEHLSKGQKAEDLAEAFLHNKGLVTHEKNFRCKLGEIDLIMRDQDVLVFVEVRLRSNPFFTNAAESVDRQKQRKIMNTASYYLQQKHLTDKVACRFDVVAIHQNTIRDSNWIMNAFGI
jgi:putative endonuclease